MCSGKLVVGDVVELVEHAVEDVRQPFKVSGEGIGGKIKDALAHRWVVEVAGNDRFGGMLWWYNLLHDPESRNPADRSEQRLNVCGNDKQIAIHPKEIYRRDPPRLNRQRNCLFSTEMATIPVFLNQHEYPSSGLVRVHIDNAAMMRKFTSEGTMIVIRGVDLDKYRNVTGIRNLVH